MTSHDIFVRDLTSYRGSRLLPPPIVPRALLYLYDDCYFYRDTQREPPWRRELNIECIVSSVMHGWIWLVTMPPGYTPGDLFDLFVFFFLGGLFPIPDTQKETIPHPRRSSTSYTFFLPVQNETFSQLFNDKRFSRVYCHNVVKKWNIYLKTKTKKKNSLKSASLIEHFIRTLDRICVYLDIYISKAFYSFSYMFSHH